MGHYVLRKTAPQQYSFVLRATNNETILVSETYLTKASAKAGIESCQTNSPKDDRYVRQTAQNGQPYFYLTAGNNHVIGVSETYSSNQARDNGIASCKVNGPTKQIVDQTGE